MYRHVTEITVNKNGICLIVGGKTTKPAVLAKKLGITTPSVHAAIKRHTTEGFEQWMNDCFVRLKYGLYRTESIYWRGQDPCWIKLVATAADIKGSSAGARLSRWSRGEIDCDELFRCHSLPQRRTVPVIDPQYTTTKIRAARCVRKWFVFIDEEKYTIKAAAEVLEIRESSLRAIILRNATDVKSLANQFNLLAWRYDNDVSYRHKLYIRFDGQAHTVITVKRFVPDISDEGARKRLKAWVTGAYTTSQLLEAEVVRSSQDNGDLLANIPEGDLAHLSNKERPCPVFKAGKYDELLAGHVSKECYPNPSNLQGHNRY